MKASVLSKEGKKLKEIELPDFFKEEVREDIILKYLEATKEKQPYSNHFLAGRLASASGKIRHARRKWKGAYGRGISRVPRKIMWRRGTQFFWIGATISGARGGRQAHPPRIDEKEKKINKKEFQKALAASLAATTDPKYLVERYDSIKNSPKKGFPFVVSKEILELKVKDFRDSLKKILGELYNVAIQQKSVRAGKGKMRNRKYKKNAGVLFVIGNEENLKVSGIEIIKSETLNPSHLASGGPGRLTVYTEQAIKNLGERIK